MIQNKLIKKFHLYDGRLSPIALDEIRNFYLTPGNIFIDKGIDKKSVKILSSTDLIDEAFLTRFDNRNLYFKIQTTMQLKWVSYIKKVFQDFKEAYLPDEFLLKSEIVQIELARALWNNDSDITLADFAYACFQIFHQHHQKLTFELYREDVQLFRRALFVSSLNVLFAYSSGYRDIKFLSDIYRVGWMLDIGLLKNNYNYAIAQACQFEKQHPGQGADFLKKMNRPKCELDAFLNHPVTSYQEAKIHYSDNLFYPELLQAIVYHHELTRGDGFPRQINYSFISDWESILILSEYLVDYTSEKQEKLYTKNLKKIWSELDYELTSYLPVYRLRVKIERMMHYWSQNAHDVKRGVSHE